VTAIQALPDKDDRGEFLIMATRHGVIKKTPRQDFENIRRTGLKAINLKGSDTLEWVNSSTGNDTILLVTRSGKAIRFEEKGVRPMGRTAAGVRSLRLAGSDEAVAMHVIPKEKTAASHVLVITEEGFGKRTALASYRTQGRGGSGIKTAKITSRTGSIVNAAILDKASLKETDVLIISQKGQVIRINADNIPEQSRDTQGVRVMRPGKESSKVATFTTISPA